MTEANKPGFDTNSIDLRPLAPSVVLVDRGYLKSIEDKADYAEAAQALRAIFEAAGDQKFEVHASQTSWKHVNTGKQVNGLAVNVKSDGQVLVAYNLYVNGFDDECGLPHYGDKLTSELVTQQLDLSRRYRDASVVVERVNSYVKGTNGGKTVEAKYDPNNGIQLDGFLQQQPLGVANFSAVTGRPLGDWTTGISMVEIESININMWVKQLNVGSDEVDSLSRIASGGRFRAVREISMSK